MYNILIGGAAGQGIETTASILEKLLKRSGYNVFTTRDFMSRIRGGHNFTLLRFGTEIIGSHSNKIDCIIALDVDTVEIHKDELNCDGFILCDEKLSINDERAVKIAFDELAKNMGNPRVSGSIAIGAILKFFGEKLDFVDDVLKSTVKQEHLEININAVTTGYNLVEEKFKHHDGNFADCMILSGSKAVALGALAAGTKFYSAYPMSPSTATMEYLASKSDEIGIVVEQAEDEIAAINMAIGASFAGARAMTGTSGGGFCLMVEALGMSGMAEIPLVVVDVQRPGPATGLPTRTEQSDLKFVISASHGEFPRMVIALRNHTDAFYQTIRAFELAEKYQIPVILLSDQYLGDTTATVPPFKLPNINNYIKDVADDAEYLRYKFTESGISPRLIPGKTKHFVSADTDEHNEYGKIIESSKSRIDMMNKRMKKIESIENDLLEPEYIGPSTFETLIIGWGSTYGAIAEAIKTLNDNEPNKYGALVFGDVYPLPKKLLLEKSAIAKNIINVEQNFTGQLAQLIRECTGIVCTFSILKYDGRQISGEEIVAKLQKGVK